MIESITDNAFNSLSLFALCSLPFFSGDGACKCANVYKSVINRFAECQCQRSVSDNSCLSPYKNKGVGLQMLIVRNKFPYWVLQKLYSNFGIFPIGNGQSYTITLVNLYYNFHLFRIRKFFLQYGIFHFPYLRFK